MSSKDQQRRQRREDARASLWGVSSSERAFKKMVRTGGRLNILIEGDSWFAYPDRELKPGPPSNIIEQVFHPLRHTERMNGLCLASNGHTLHQIANNQLGRIEKILRTYGRRIDLLLLSAGGNDVVAEKQLKILLLDYQSGFKPGQCINRSAWAARLKRLRTDFEKVLDLQHRYAPAMPIVTHVYDLAEPTPRKGRVFGFWPTGPWMWPAMNRRGIPEDRDFRSRIIEDLLFEHADQLRSIQAANADRVYLAETIGRLRQGNLEDWADEIHPTPSGFKKITGPVYASMRQAVPQLPQRPDLHGYQLIIR